MESDSCHVYLVFLPLNLIASIGGMSEWSMMTKGLHWWISYTFFSLGMIVFGWMTWFLMKKMIDRVPSSTNTSAKQKPLSS